jgi:transposase
MESKQKKRKVLMIMKTWNRRPERVKAEIFHTHSFFDPEDMAQVKYEMLRAREAEGNPLNETCARFGFTRESYRHILNRFQSEGIGGLFGRKRGRKGPVKAKEELRQFIRSEHAKEETVTEQELLKSCYRKFGVTISRRTVFRILAETEKGKKKRL